MLDTQIECQKVRPTKPHQTLKPNQNPKPNLTKTQPSLKLHLQFYVKHVCKVNCLHRAACIYTSNHYYCLTKYLDITMMSKHKGARLWSHCISMNE